METKTTQEEQEVVVRKLVPFRRIFICPELGLKTTMEPYCDDEEVSEKTKVTCPTCGR